jgi:hypothetical protein
MMSSAKNPIAMPTSIKLKELPPALRPDSEAAGNTRSDAGTKADRDMIASVIERWRNATMSQKLVFEDEASELGSPPREEAVPLAPIAASPSADMGLSPGLDPKRYGTIRKPIVSEANVLASSRQPTRWR